MAYGPCERRPSAQPMPAPSKRTRVHVLRGGLLHLGDRFGGDAGRVDGVHVHVRGEPRNELALHSGDQIDDAGRDVGGLEDFAQRDRGERAATSEVTATTVLPPTIAGAMRLTSPRSAGSSGATTPTTPVGSGTVKL